MDRTLWTIGVVIVIIAGIIATIILLKAKHNIVTKITILLALWAIIVAIAIPAALELWPPTQKITVEDSDHETAEEVENCEAIPVTKEEEPNDTVEDANLISINSDVHGALDTNQDTDYYYFSIDEKSSVLLDFSHDIIDDESVYWEVSILCLPSDFNTSDMKEIQVCDIYGNQIDSTFGKLRLNPGTYYIKVERAYNYSELPYIFKLKAETEGDNVESEPNGETSLAKINNSISLNTVVSGNLQTEDDVDYYHFTISQPGILNIKFSHEFIDSDQNYWDLTVLGDNVDNNSIYTGVQGNSTNTDTDNIRVSPNTDGTAKDYYLKVERYNYSSIDYSFIINYSPEEHPTATNSGAYTYDKEPNNDPKIATLIDLNKQISGNIQTKNDVDYYKINIPKDGRISIVFQHEFKDTADVCWEADILGGSGDVDMEFPNIRSRGEQESISSDNANIPAGTYYIRVRPYYYDNSDYKFTVKYA